MKELSIEEKAKRYDEAIERAKAYHNDYTKDIMEDIFPELKESEDDKVRKKLIHLVKKSHEQGGYALHKWESDEMLAWLEKQGEQKPDDKVVKFNVGDKVYNIKDKFECTIESIDDTTYYCDTTNFDIKDQEGWELVEQRPAEWSREDECAINVLRNIIKKSEIIDSIIYTDSVKEKLYAWLKSLKDRVQPKVEWSEDDENNILFLTSIIEECFKNKEKITLYGDTVCANFTKEDVIDRLKSLRPHSQWKPSDEQMGVIEAVINNRSFQRRHLDSLYEQLKKLREEI